MHTHTRLAANSVKQDLLEIEEELHKKVIFIRDFNATLLKSVISNRQKLKT